MNINDLYGLVFAFILLAICLAAFFIVVGVFFPRRIARTRLIITDRPWRSLLVGMINFLFFGGLTLVVFHLANAHPGGPNVLGVLLLALVGIGISLGLAGVVDWLGERLAPGKNTYYRTSAGSLLLSLACALPFVGWFGLLPFAVFLGLGALIISFFNREQPPSPPA